MRYCWSCKPGLLFAASGETLSFWLGGCPTYWLSQLKGPRQMSGWHLSGEAEGAGGDTDVAKSLGWWEKEATSLPLPCGRCSGLAAPGISVQFDLRFINTELFSQARQGELKRGKLWGSPSQG